MSIEMSLPSGHDRLGAGLDEMVHDRKVVRREVPEHIDIVLK